MDDWHVLCDGDEIHRLSTIVSALSAMMKIKLTSIEPLGEDGHHCTAMFYFLNKIGIKEARQHWDRRKYYYVNI